MLTPTWLTPEVLRAIADQVGTPCFIYSERQLKRNLARAYEAVSLSGLLNPVSLYVPFFANSNPHVVKTLTSDGAGLLLQLPNEYDLLWEHGNRDFIVSPGHVSDDELQFWADTGCRTYLSSLSEVEFWLRHCRAPVCVRIDLLESEKPGLKLAELESLSKLVGSSQQHVESFEVYCGSGRTVSDMLEVARLVLTLFTDHFTTASSINFTGGHGFSYKSWDEQSKHFAWLHYFSELKRESEKARIPKNIAFLFEPARDLLADAGTLLLSIKRDLITGPTSKLVITDGSRMLMPSAQHRNRRHNLVFLTSTMDELRSSDRTNLSLIRGCTVLRNDYLLPGEYPVPNALSAGDYALVLDVGAYCATQHMEFMSVQPPAEILVMSDETLNLISTRGHRRDRWRHVVPKMRRLGHSLENERIHTSE